MTKVKRIVRFLGHEVGTHVGEGEPGTAGYPELTTYKGFIPNEIGKSLGLPACNELFVMFDCGIASTEIKGKNLTFDIMPDVLLKAVKGDE